jgi:phospholipid/cholesterol/gamma-HCH transport system ATP-binding protein
MALPIVRTTPEECNAQMRKAGILYQSGALWSSMTLAENIAVPLEAYPRSVRGKSATPSP